MNKIDSHLNQQECEESFEKQCSITFKQQAYNETVRKCYRPVEKVCSGQGPEVCRTVYEASCSTKYVGVSQKQYKKLAIDIFRYVEKLPGQFLSDSQCEKLPVEICGAGCTFEEGPEKCHNKVRTGTLEHYKESERPRNHCLICYISRLLHQLLKCPRRCVT